MRPSRAVVIPFAVPAEGRGLGLGLAALVHAFVHVEGGGVALAQLQGKHARHPDGEQGSGAGAAPVEAFVPPETWRDISGRGDAPSLAGLVLTGSFEPPIDGAGALQLLAFDVQDGSTRARVEVPLEGSDAGAALVAALRQLGSHLGGEIGVLEELRELAWDPLESVLRAERCALHDPARGGPHDHLAAMLHLGRAIGDAPRAHYPASRLAWLALEVAAGAAPDPLLVAAAVRALERAAADAPEHVEILEALASLLLRMGRSRDAQRRITEAIALAPSRPRPYVLFSQALRSQGQVQSALAAVEDGLARLPDDPVLLAERGVVQAVLGDLDAAATSWQRALSRDPVQPVAFTSVAALALRRQDVTGAQKLVDAALAEPRSSPDVLRRALQLALSTEADGLPRASRVAKLAERILTIVPADPQASVALARAQIALGERDKARVRLAQVVVAAPDSGAAADAQLTQLALDNPGAEAELRSVWRAAQSAPVAKLGDVGARARRLATLHGAWLGWMAAALADRRLGRWVAARGALELALESAPGAAPAHAELASVLLELQDVPRAAWHARRAAALDGDSARAFAVLSRALAASGRRAEALASARHAVALQPEDPEARAALATVARPARGQRWTWSTQPARRLLDFLRGLRRPR